MNNKFCFILFVSLLLSASASALSYNQKVARATVEEYYRRLQACANKPDDISLQTRVIDLFDNEGVDGNVFNDLLFLKGTNLENQSDGITYYLSTIMSLWTRKNYHLKITSEIDDDTFEEQLDPDVDSDVKKYAVWVTVTKNVSCYTGSRIFDSFSKRETFKVKDGKIQTISPPEESTWSLDAIKLYNDHNYSKAYDAFMKEILNGRADQDTYYYIGLMLRKGQGCKDRYPREVRDKMCVFYWMKTYRGKKALYALGVHHYYLPVAGYTPFNNGLMAVYKGEGKSFGYMDEEGKMVIPYKYDWAGHFAEGLAAVKYKGKWGFIDVHGKNVINPSYFAISSYSCGMFACQVNKDDKVGYKNMNNEWVIPPTWDKADGFLKCGLAYVQTKIGTSYKVGVINKNGTVVIPIEYYQIIINQKSGIVRMRKTITSEFEETAINNLINL